MNNNNGILSIPKLMGRENWSSWSFAVKAYLQHEDLYDCILTEPTPDDPKSMKSDVKAKSKLILLVDPILYIHIQDAKNAKQLWENLTKSFEDSGLTRKVGLLKDLINTTLETSESVEAYVNKIMSSAHKLRNINFNVDEEWLGTLMLAGLPDTYKPMIMGIESSGVKISADMIKIKLLQEIKSIDSDTTVLYTKHSKFNKPNNNKNQKKGPRCFNCNRYNHLSKDCWFKKNKKEQSNNNSGYVAVFSATAHNDNGWYIDSGASMHMTMRQDWLYDDVPPPITSIKIANDKMLPVKRCGKVDLQVITNKGKQTVQIKNVMYVPELATNLLSVSQIIKNGCSVQFTNNGCKIFNNKKIEVASAHLINNMYRLNINTIPAYNCKAENSDFLLWHQRMAHLNFKDLNKMIDSTDGVKLVKNINKIICEFCQQGKQSRLPFPAEGSRAKKPLELIHSDICGPMEVKSLGGARNTTGQRQYLQLPILLTVVQHVRCHMLHLRRCGVGRNLM
ncbi:unnamed protein product [Euphydryas editha]|uniref:CCHC-type domain-containing protein n=1 Tax=Euphydryas editha TaxID=104508 RepID=A0AAU9USN3_EUPED|nr:unnamed protein product [Euphydryas editha]